MSSFLRVSVMSLFLSWIFFIFLSRILFCTNTLFRISIRYLFIWLRAFCYVLFRYFYLIRYYDYYVCYYFVPLSLRILLCFVFLSFSLCVPLCVLIALFHLDQQTNPLPGPNYTGPTHSNLSNQDQTTLIPTLSTQTTYKSLNPGLPNWTQLLA